MRGEEPTGGFDFNPRSREGSDVPTTASRHTQEISIHAPVKGATLCRSWLVRHIPFQSTLP